MYNMILSNAKKETYKFIIIILFILIYIFIYISKHILPNRNQNSYVQIQHDFK